MYLNELIGQTRSELHWECDYLREAKIQTCTIVSNNLIEYRNLILSAYPDEYYVPQIVDSMTTKHILCSELLFDG